nr:MAG: DUF488 domain-containing protein [Bacillota bacterium]
MRTTAATIHLGRIYDSDLPPGYRVLVDRLWPRGIAREKAPWDAWWRDLTPSDQLRRWLHVDREARWSEFPLRYRMELDAAPEAAVAEALAACRQGPVVLLTAARDPEHSHAAVLRLWLLERLEESEAGK